ncbi:hypothetical protein Micbo1qcDRAFT_215022 [Microdochium bolleyi]|uniref:Uncharacterized protein n=1 Tax=Microdochium bolleyi TaxID=196109 RepID=A0A136ISR5_9PEZI|nr:hypothetical protein Micbo1qcDRAFT_215022 [Microdochium bolleyi]
MRYTSIPCREPPAETAAVSAYFSSQIHTLYEQLAAHQVRMAASLAEEGLPAIDTERGIFLHLKNDRQDFDYYSTPFCHHRKLHAHRLTLEDPETLPQLPFVRRLFLTQGGTNRHVHEAEHDGVRPISLRSVLECLVRLPGVEEIDCDWLWEWHPLALSGRGQRHYTRVWEGPWRDARREFGAAMADPEAQLGYPIPPTLTRTRLWFWHERCLFEDEQARAMPDLVAPALRDPLCAGLGILAAQLEELDLRAYITEDLFPAADAPVTEQWSRMRRLKIEFHACRPDGSWYFVGPRGEDPHPTGYPIPDGNEDGAREFYPPLETTAEDEELDELWEDDPWDGHGGEYDADNFRTEPVAERIEPLLAAFAAAVKSMDALEDADMFVWLGWCPGHQRQAEYGDAAPYDIEDGTHRWGVRYIAGGNRDSTEGGPRFEWQVGDWRPSERVLKMFEELGSQEWLDFKFCSNGSPRAVRYELSNRRHRIY